MVKITTKSTAGGKVTTPANSDADDTPYKPDFSLVHKNYVTVREEPDAEKVTYSFEREHIRKTKREEEFLIVGFDTEYQAEKAVSNTKVKLGLAKYKVLSYQFYAKTKDGIEWSGIVLPDEFTRLSFSEFIVYVIGKGVESGKIKFIPNHIYLVAHYNRADIPAFDDKDVDFH